MDVLIEEITVCSPDPIVCEDTEKRQLSVTEKETFLGQLTETRSLTSQTPTVGNNFLLFTCHLGPWYFCYMVFLLAKTD